MTDAKLINWADLPSELLYSILSRLSGPDRLVNAWNVCRSWRRVCQDPLMWRKLALRDMGKYEEAMDHCHAAETICRRAVDLSQGGLLEISIEYFATDSLLAYIADRSSNLKHLVLTECDELTDVGLLEAVTKLTMLEHLVLTECDQLTDAGLLEEAVTNLTLLQHLEFSHLYFVELDLELIGLSCPLLKTLKLNYAGAHYLRDECDDDALAIARTMPGLHHLQLIRNRLTNAGLKAIVESCPHLKCLDLRNCGNVNLAPQ